MDEKADDIMGKLREINEDILTSIKLIKRLTLEKNSKAREREKLQKELDKYLMEDYHSNNR